MRPIFPNILRDTNVIDPTLSEHAGLQLKVSKIFSKLQIIYFYYHV